MLYGTTKKELEKKVLDCRKELKQSLINAKLLVVTFGTAWGYRHIEQDHIVGNCHKAPAKVFQKELTSIQELKLQWEEILIKLHEVNPDLEIMFTVSPVRHKKDGLVDNNRSKSRLIELVHSLENCHYFPSYEILIDELRDYRFYSEDMVHPSREAISYIWDKFREAVFIDDTIDLMKRVAQNHALLEHKSLHPETVKDKQRIQNAVEERRKLSALYPKIIWK